MSAPVRLRLCDALAHARTCRASDLHFQPGNSPIVRVDGLLVETSGERLTAPELESIVEELLQRSERTKLEALGDVSASWSDGEGNLARVHAYRAHHGYVVAMRLLGKTVPQLDDLGFPETVSRLAHLERGLVIVCGATGSGKSTTVAAIVDRINASRACRIITIEDPIEYRHESRRSVITQRELGRDTPRLELALQGALRADPDVVVVGEMRDPATMRAALSAAETGHLVLTTLHAGDAAQTIDRIVDAFNEPTSSQVRAQLAAVLEGVVYQILVPRPCGGRRAAAEILIGTDAVRNLIRESKGHHLRNAMATGRRFGMQTLEQHLDDLRREGAVAS